MKIWVTVVLCFLLLVGCSDKSKPNVDALVYETAKTTQ